MCRIKLLFLLLYICKVYAYTGEYCFTGTNLDHCTLGCCGDGPVKTCCGMSTMAIVGLVIGVLMMLASLVCCGFCIYYMCKKRGNRTRTVPVQPYNNTNSVFVHNAPYGHPPSHAPPSYNQYNSYPGSSSQPPGYSDPSYPPGTVSSGHPPPSYKKF